MRPSGHQQQRREQSPAYQNAQNAALGGNAGAFGLVKETLDQLGLGALADWAWTKVQHGEDWSQIRLEMHDTPEFKARFPAYDTLAKQGRLVGENPEASYIALENSYRDVLHSYGLPTGFYDQPADFAKFMIGNVSPSELNDRVKEYTGAVMGDQTTLSEMQRLYGEHGHSNNPQGDLLAMYLDPQVAEPLLTQQFHAAQFASAAVRSGFGQLSKAEAEQYGAQAGTSVPQAEQGFGQLYAARELTHGLPGENQQDISRDTLLGAAFGGSAADQDAINKRARLRVAEGQGGGGFSSTQRGVSGLTSSEV